MIQIAKHGYEEGSLLRHRKLRSTFAAPTAVESATCPPTEGSMAWAKNHVLAMQIPDEEECGSRSAGIQATADHRPRDITSFEHIRRMARPKTEAAS